MRSPVRVFLLSLMLVALLPAPARAQTTSYVDAAAEGLQRTPIYVHPDADPAPTTAEVDQLLARLQDSDVGPVYIAVLPDEARNEAGGDSSALLPLINERLRRQGVYAVIAGRTFRAGTTDGTAYESGVVPAIAGEAIEGADDVDTVLSNFITGLEEARAGRGPAAQRETSGGFGLLPILLIAGLGFFGLRAFRNKRQNAEHLAEVRQVAEEDLTTMGNEVYDLEREFTMPGAHPEARRHYDEAIVAYQQARSVLESARRTEDLAGATEAMERGRYSLAATRAVLAGQPVPEHRPPCFFEPAHGPSTRDVAWAPDGGAPRAVPACEADAMRVERGEEPMSRQITVGGYSRPYWDAPPWYGGYYGGYYGGFGGLGFLQGMMFGSMFGGFGMGGWGMGGYGGGDSGGGGDFGGGFGGGDFGGGDFGGGDF